jgi:type IV pilus assembly protein PilQ
MKSVTLLLTALLLMPLAVEGAQNVRLTGLRIDPVVDGAELMIELSGAASFEDFALGDPARIVIDVRGANGSLPLNRYIVDRGGVSGIRSSQYSADVVRVVIDLDREAAYSARAVPGGIMLRLATGAVAFEPWRTAPVGEAAALATGPLAMSIPSVAVAPLIQPVQAQEQPRITVTFQDADIRDVLASFAEFTGRSIVPGLRSDRRGDRHDPRSAVGRRAADDPARLRPGRAGAAERDHPGRRDRAAAGAADAGAAVTETFRINYVPVGRAGGEPRDRSLGAGRISTNPSTNTLIVTDVESVSTDMRRMLGQLDVRTPQVSIQAKIIFVNRTDVEELGVTYDLKDSQGSSLNRLVAVPDPFDPGDFTSTDLSSASAATRSPRSATPTRRVQQPQLEAVLSLVLGRHTLISFIDALQSQELSDVQAAPTDHDAGQPGGRDLGR